MSDDINSSDETPRHCLFENHPSSRCEKTTHDVYSPTPARVTSISKSSIERGELLHLDIPEKSAVHVHRNCVSWYCSPEHIKRAAHHDGARNSDVPVKRLRTEKDKNFNAKKHCIFCGTECTVDKKHPGRTKKFSTCRVKDRVKRSDGQYRTFKEEIERICDIINDERSDIVRLRLCCVSDLPAGDVQYHHKCRTEFMHQDSGETKSRCDEDLAFQEVVKIMDSDSSKLWSSVEAFETYKKCGGRIETRQYFQEKLLSWYNGKLLVFKSAGVVSMLMFMEQAKVMNLSRK